MVVIVVLVVVIIQAVIVLVVVQHEEAVVSGDNESRYDRSYNHARFPAGIHVAFVYESEKNENA